MATLTPADYSDAKAFLAFFLQHHPAPFAAPDSPSLASLHAAEQMSPARASSILRMGLNDCLEKSSHWQPAQIQAIDAALAARGLLTLSHVRQRYWGRYKALCKRGHIGSDLEWALARGVLADARVSLPATERQLLADMTAHFLRDAS